MSGHTPGPWVPMWNIQVYGESRYQISTREKSVAYTCEGCQEPTHEHTANARLIAAAPDLLEALQSVLAGATSYQLREYEQCVLDARAAIAKATGND